MVTVNVEIVEGRGSVVVSKNGSVVATVNPGDGLVPVTYNVGDSFFFQAYPDTTNGFSFNKFCGDTACTIVSTTNPFGGTISANGYLGVYFTGTPATINVYSNSPSFVGGKVDVYRNGRLAYSVTSARTINCFINDIVRFIATSSPGYSFSRYCSDANCTQYTTVVNPFETTITASSGNMYAFFTSSTPTPTPPPGSIQVCQQSNQSGNSACQALGGTCAYSNCNGGCTDHPTTNCGCSAWCLGISTTQPPTTPPPTTPPPSNVTVTMRVSPAGSGIILTNNQNVSSITVSSGTYVTWQANPNNGWRFDHFVGAGGVTTTQNPFGTTVTSSGSVTAVFVSTTQPPTTQPPTTPPPTTQPPTTQPPPTLPECIGCDLTTNFCIPSLGCVPKQTVLYGAVGFIALMMLR